MHVQRNQCRFKFDSNMVDFEILKPRIVRAALVALANTDEYFWKSSTSTMRGVIAFEVVFPPNMKKTVVEDPKARYERLNAKEEKAGCLFTGNPQIAIVKNKITQYFDALKVKPKSADLVKVLDDLDDYEYLLSESKPEVNKYYFDLLIRVKNSLHHVDIYEASYTPLVDYKGPAIINKALYAKRMEIIGANLFKFKDLFKPGAWEELQGQFKKLVYNINEFPLLKSLPNDISELSKTLKEKLDFKLVEACYNKVSDCLIDHNRKYFELSVKRSTILFNTQIDTYEAYLRLAELCWKYRHLLETTDTNKSTKIRFSNDEVRIRYEKIEMILSFLRKHYPTLSLPDECENINEGTVTELANKIIDDREILRIFQGLTNILISRSQFMPRARSAYISLTNNLKRDDMIASYVNLISLHKRLMFT